MGKAAVAVHLADHAGGHGRAAAVGEEGVYGFRADPGVPVDAVEHDGVAGGTPRLGVLWMIGLVGRHFSGSFPGEVPLEEQASLYDGYRVCRRGRFIQVFNRPLNIFGRFLPKDFLDFSTKKATETHRISI
jgi:hypothetical protein